MKKGIYAQRINLLLQLLSHSDRCGADHLRGNCCALPSSPLTNYDRSVAICDVELLDYVLAGLTRTKLGYNDLVEPLFTFVDERFLRLDFTTTFPIRLDVTHPKERKFYIHSVEELLMRLKYTTFVNPSSEKDDD